MKKLLYYILIAVALLAGCAELDTLIPSNSNSNDSGSNTVTQTTPEIEEVEIVRVIDGDTVVIDNGSSEETVRLLLIDTPESVHPDKPVQPFGDSASNFLKELLTEGQTVGLERGIEPLDKHDRTLGYIWFEGENINQRLIEEGYARVAYVFEPNTKYLDEFREAEEHAKNKGVNIWSIANYVTEQGFVTPE